LSWLVETKIKIEDRFLKFIEKRAKIRNTTKNEVINEMIKKKIEKEDIPDFLEMGGMFTTEEPFNAVEDRKKMRDGEL